MSGTNGDSCTEAQSINEKAWLRQQLEEMQQTREAIRHGDIDALAVIGPKGYMLKTARPAELPAALRGKGADS